MSLSSLIPPEIKNDNFYEAILRTLTTRTDTKTIIEIGSSSGEGSTKALLEGSSSYGAHLFCLEISQERINKLLMEHEGVERLKAYRYSSVPIDQFMTKDQVADFYNTVKTSLNQYPLDMVIQWHDQDVNYIRDNSLEQNGISKIKADHGIDIFDVAFIDGSCFTAEAELKQVYGSSVIMLDDTNDIKNYRNLQALLKDDSYKLLQQDNSIRNGFAIFERIR